MSNILEGHMNDWLVEVFFFNPLESTSPNITYGYQLSLLSWLSALGSVHTHIKSDGSCIAWLFLYTGWSLGVQPIGAACSNQRRYQMLIKMLKQIKTDEEHENRNRKMQMVHVVTMVI